MAYDFDSDSALMHEAEKCIDLICSRKITKYNERHTSLTATLYGPKKERRILVIGQVDDEQSVIFGCDRKITNSDLVALAAHENPGAQIIYKPHPDVVQGKRAELSSPHGLTSHALILRQPISLDDALTGVDHVYTITSLGGFEALLRGVSVTTLGAPFYAGWGLTDSRQVTNRRGRKLTVTQVFAAAYLKYAIYLDPATGIPLKLSNLIEKFSQDDKEIYFENDVLSELTEAAAETLSAESVPQWFKGFAGQELNNAIESEKPIFIYIPWIAEHGDKLIQKIESRGNYLLVPLDFVSDLENNRSEVLRFARENPHVYRKMLFRRMVPLKQKIKGVIFTFDWAPVMRLIAGVCEDLEIPRILIPHESVFVDRDKYYWDLTAQASVPVADVVLGWGQLQKDIFTERGYPVNRIVSVGAPKFDSYHHYRPELTRRQFFRVFGLNPDQKTILFASQPLDSQLDAKAAREFQQRAISDVLDCVEERNLQLIIRLPPSKDNILSGPLQQRIAQSVSCVVDDAICYLVTAEESLYHTELVVSVNSTMLFEGLLMGRAPISTKYCNFEQIWERSGIPFVHNIDELGVQIDVALAGHWQPSQEGMKWAARMFSVGDFDGKACARIAEYLGGVASGAIELTLRPNALERVFSSSDSVDVVAIPSTEQVWNTLQKNLLPMIRARKRVASTKGVKNIKELASVDVFVQWGIAPNVGKIKQAVVQRALGRPLLIIEDGFIRSMNIGLSGEPGLSIIMDDTTAYYDATKASRLQRLLEGGPNLTEQQSARSKKAIQRIVETRVSKYNHAPNLSLNIGVPGKRKVLLIDQRFGDQSVASGLADEQTYERMLNEVIIKHSECDIIVKQHPDAIKGGKSSYYSKERLDLKLDNKILSNLHLINFDVNPYALFDLVDEVYVVTSGMGFEALMAGKTVHCYGMPFYAGWGVTEDIFSISGRTRSRKIEEIFYYSYIESSRYFHPDRNKVVEIEDIIDFIVEKREY